MEHPFGLVGLALADRDAEAGKRLLLRRRRITGDEAEGAEQDEHGAHHQRLGKRVAQFTEVHCLTCCCGRTREARWRRRRRFEKARAYDGAQAGATRRRSPSQPSDICPALDPHGAPLAETMKSKAAGYHT